KHDGRFVQDWEYKKGSGNLDECNGAMMNGKYVYFATETYPFYPLCHWGTVSADFQQRGSQAGNKSRPQPPRDGRGGPLAAAAAELGISERRLADAVGPPPPNIKRAARILGISEAKLREVMRRHRPR
ncbi:MAG: YHYH protein, partial [Pseudomonadota bacterium]